MTMKISKNVKKRAQEETYPAIVKMFMDNGRVPKLREVQKKLNWPSFNKVARDVEVLRHLGWLEKDDMGHMTVPGMRIVPDFDVESRLRDAGEDL